MFGIDYLSVMAGNWHNAAIAYGHTMVTANEVIWRRSLKLATGTMTPEEAVLMVIEKPVAFARAAQDAGEAASLGRDLSAIAGAALAPLSMKVLSNAQRLRG